MSEPDPAGRIAAPVKLEKHHRVDDFDSGAEELDLWLKTYAWANHVAGNARVFVATRDDLVVGYYTLSSAGVAQEQVPADLKNGGAPDPLPAVGPHGGEPARARCSPRARPARRRTAPRGPTLRRPWVRALLIHALDENAMRWYQHQARTFRPSPSNPLHLFLPIKELRRLASDR